jgi:hypothetical protein
MRSGCKHIDDSGTPTASGAPYSARPYAVSSGTRTRGSSPCIDGGKTACGECGRENRPFYDRKVGRSASVLWGLAHVPGRADPSRLLPTLRDVKQERLAWLTERAL